MAEFAAIQIVASIIQVIDVGVRIIERLDDFREKANGLPRTFRHISTKLPLLVDALRQTKEVMEGMSDSTRKAFKPAIEECLVQVKKLDETIKAIVPKAGDTGMSRSWKAVISVKYDSEIKEMDRVIKDYMEVMAQHQTSAMALQSMKVAKAPPTPVSTCSYARDPDFVTRDAMDEVMSRCLPGLRLALTGIGGVGKSQIAIEFTYRVRTTSPQTWVFWVDAKDTTSVKSSYTKIAGALQLPGWDEQNTDVFALVRDWLVDENHGPWAMVVDSVDDTSVLTDPVHKPQQSGTSVDVSLLPQLREFLAIARNGSVLITSTNNEAAHMLTGNFAYHVDVGEMTENEAMALLKSKLHRKVAYTEDEAIELVKAAECMPLAISQIAARISADYPRFGLSQAIEKLKDPDQDTSRLLEGSVHESNRDVRRTNSIVKSWHINFQYVQERNRSAARLFSLMCLFDRQDIPKALLAGHYGEEVTAPLAPTPRHLSLWKRIRRRSLRRRSKRTEENKGVINNSHSAFDDDWHVLNNLMLIKTSLDGCHFSMHRLIQHTTRRWLELNGELKAWMQKHIMIMFQYFPKPSSDTWEVCEYLLPHAQQAVKYRPSDAPTLRLWAPLIHTLGQYVSSKGNKSAAEQLHRLALEGLLVVVGEHHEVTLRCLQNLGGEVNALRRPAEAEPIYRRAWEGRRTLLGEDHVDTLQSANSLGSVLNSLKRYDEGDAMHARVIEGYERTFGPTHNETLTILSILQFGHAMDGRFDKCAELCRRTQVADKEIHGEESDEYLEYMQALGGLENLQGRHAEAERILQEVVRLRVERFNYHHRDTIASINYLCDALVKQGKLDEALGWYRHVEDAYPDLDKKTREAALESLDHLARVLAQLGQLGEAETLARYMIDERERLLGPDDSYTLLGYHTLADILTQREQLRPALDMYEKAYFGLRNMAGPVEDTNEFMNDYNAAKNRLLQWSGNEDRQSLDTCKPQEETVDSAPILAFQSPEPVFA